MMKRPEAVLKTCLIAFFGLAFLAACSSTPTTYSQADPTVDFSEYKTFGFYDSPATNDAATNPW